MTEEVSRTPHSPSLKSAAWAEYVHLRAEEKYAHCQGKLSRLLQDIASNTEGDPVLTSEECVLWTGPVCNETPVVSVYDPETQDFNEEDVSRTMAFLFVDDDSYRAVLASTPPDRTALENLCNTVNCVNVRHLVIPD